MKELESGLRRLLLDVLNPDNRPSSEYDDLILKLDQLSQEHQSEAADALRADFERVRDELEASFREEIGRAIVSVATPLNIPLALAGDAQPAATKKRPRLNAAKRQKLADQLLNLLRDRGAQGLSKAEVARQLSVSINQAKGLLRHEHVQRRITRIGSGERSRYVLRVAEAG